MIRSRLLARTSVAYMTNVKLKTEQTEQNEGLLKNTRP